jgi:hypothetical protein
MHVAIRVAENWIVAIALLMLGSRRYGRGGAAQLRNSGVPALHETTPAAGRSRGGATGEVELLECRAGVHRASSIRCAARLRDAIARYLQSRRDAIIKYLQSRPSPDVKVTSGAAPMR